MAEDPPRFRGRGFGMTHNIAAALRVFAASWVLVMFPLITDAKARVLDRSLSFRQIAQELKTPEDLARFLWRNFIFEEDQTQFGREEYWQTPEEFLNHRKGDCEDFALFAQQVLRLNGIPAILLNVYGGDSHTVCIFKENGKYQLLDGTDVHHLDADNLRDLVGFVDPFWKKGAIVAPSETSNQGRVLTEFERKLKIHRAFSTSA